MVGGGNGTGKCIEGLRDRPVAGVLLNCQRAGSIPALFINFTDGIHHGLTVQRGNVL